jgi:hypothetical protein
MPTYARTPQHHPIPPLCTWCGERVGGNEYDHESGGYFSSHFGCTSEVKGGAFYVVAYYDGQLQAGRSDEGGTVYGYTTLKRAVAYAEHLASFNRGAWEFHVYDYDHDAPRATFSGRLPEPVQS